MQNGEDFIGTMAFARRSIGMALLCAVSADRELIDDSDPFWHEYATSVQWLDIASDRLRQFFVLAIPSKRGKRAKGRVAPLFAEPFEEAARLADEHNKPAFASLSLIAKRLQGYGLDRNSIVHKRASMGAKLYLEVLRTQREHAKTGQPIEMDFSFEHLQRSTMHNPLNDERDIAIQKMKEWYKDLVDASNLVFWLESRSRPPMAGKADTINRRSS